VIYFYCEVTAEMLIGLWHVFWLLRDFSW